MEEDRTHTFVNPYADEECSKCETHGTPCLSCAEESNGVNGPGMVDGRRVLTPASTHPNVFMSMVYWWNNHPMETIAVRLVPYVNPTAPFFDINITALGMLGRGFGGTLGLSTNKSTVYIPIPTSEPQASSKSNQGKREYYKPVKNNDSVCDAGVCDSVCDASVCDSVCDVCDLSDLSLCGKTQ